MTALTPFQCDVLAAVQEPLPLCERPFERLAAGLHCTEQTLLDEIRRLKADGLIRRYRPQLRYRAMGRSAVLAAAAVPEERFDQTAAIVSALSSVSHNYQRDGRLNLWFTLQGASIDEIDAALDRLRQTAGLPFFSFPALTVYKLDVQFDPAGPGPRWFEPRRVGRAHHEIGASHWFESCRVGRAHHEIGASHWFESCRVGHAHHDARHGTKPLTPDEINVIQAIQMELPLEPRPFEAMLKDAAVSDPMTVLRSLADKGVLSKIAAVLNYPRLGYTANAMVCAVVDDARIDPLGQALAQIPAVTHCYHRRPCPDWPYTLYAMFHADTLDRIADFVRSFFHTHNIADFNLLPTVRELKKSPVLLCPSQISNL
jgi:DNA-binding Lrp family transcriptional regulator